MHPILPDWTAFGAAIERKPYGDQTGQQQHTTEHERPTPLTRPIIEAELRHFQARERSAKAAPRSSDAASVC
jgi:hypothetical protein